MNIAFKHCEWFSEPPHWSISNNILNVRTDGKTDFWRETHYGFTRDTGHFLATAAGRGFTAQLRVRASYSHLHDQAVLMMRAELSYHVWKDRG